MNYLRVLHGVCIYRVLRDNWIKYATLDHVEAHRKAKEYLLKEVDNVIDGKCNYMDIVTIAPIYLYPWEVDFFLENLYVEY